MQVRHVVCVFFFFNDTATTEIYTLSLHDALPICNNAFHFIRTQPFHHQKGELHRSEEHTSELQSRLHLVCRLLLEKKQNACAHNRRRVRSIHLGTERREWTTP